MNTLPRLVQRMPTSAWMLAILMLGTATTRATEFGYHEPVGPTKWCGLDAGYTPCCGAGGKQSPINIVSSIIQPGSKLSKFKLKLEGATTLSVVHNGHTVQANVPAGAGTLELDGTVYNLLQFHFHTPSEHALAGTHMPLEMHLVHKTADGSKAAVVGVFIMAGDLNTELDKIWTDLPAEEGKKTEVTGFHLHKLLPKEDSTYRYAGSLTTPPCTEGVAWNIFTTPITMSLGQIAKFQAVFSGKEFPNGNARPTQPVGERKISTDNK